MHVHQTAVNGNKPHKYRGSVDEGETVEFDVVQGKQRIEAANVTRPVDAPAEGGSFAANRPSFCRGFYNHHCASEPRGPWEAEDDNEDGEGSRDGFTIAQGWRHCLPSRPSDQRLWRFLPFRRVQAVTSCLLLFVPTSGLLATHLPVSAPCRRAGGSSTVGALCQLLSESP